MTHTQIANTSSEETTIPTSQTPARTRQDIGVLIQDELSIAGVTESSFAALKEEAQALALMEVSSDADVQALQKVITKGVRLCTTISATIEPGKKWAHQLHKAYTSNENEFLGTVKAIIEPLKQKKEAWVARKEQQEREELERKEAVIKARFAALEGFGFTRRTGVGREDYFSNGSTELEILAVSSADEGVWANMLKGIETAFKEEQDRIEATERAKRDEEERARTAAAELEKRRMEVEAKEALMNARVNEARKNELLAIGLEMIGDNIGISARGKELFNLAAYRLHEIPDAQWADELLAAKAAKAANEEAEARAALEQGRYNRMRNAGYGSECDDREGGECHFTMTFDGRPWNITHHDCYALSDEEFDKLLNNAGVEANRRKEAELQAARAKAVKDEQERVMREVKEAREKEEDRQRRMNDAQRWEEWTKNVEKNAPRMASEIGKHAVSRVIEGMEKMTPGLLADLSK